MKRIALLLIFALVSSASAAGFVLADDPRSAAQVSATNLPPALAGACTLCGEGNWAEALDAFRAALAPTNGPAAAGPADPAAAVACVQQAMHCLRALRRTAESEDFLDAVLAAHPLRPVVNRDQLEAGCETWFEGLEAAPVRIAVASAFLSLPHHGSFVEGRFVRDSWNARPGDASERDRARALRLLDELRPYADGLDPAVRAALFRSLAAALRNGRVFNLTWRLQEKTDLAALPEIAEGWGDRDMSFPPVGPDGAPLFHARPASWDAAATDGERWVWALARLGETAPAEEARERMAFAMGQFGPDSLSPREADAMDLPSLADGETAARLATGPARFRLPDEWNPVLLAEKAGGPLDFYELGRWFEMRRQIDRAAAAYRRIGDDAPELRDGNLRRLLAPWVAVSNVGAGGATPAAAPAFDLVFRNATNAVFELRPVDEAAAAREVEALVRAWPTNRIVDWRETRTDPAARLDADGGTNLLGAPVASWSAALDPDPLRLDRTVRVAAPAPLPAGAYLLRAATPGGNAAHALLRVADTALLSPAPGRPDDPDAPPDTTPLLVADAVDGHPVAGAEVSLLRWSRPDSVRECRFRASRATTGADGVAHLPYGLRDGDGTKWWAEADLCAVTNAEGRRLFAQGLLSYNPPPRTSRDGGGDAAPFLATDRPAYRPGATVRYKVWVEHAGHGPDAGARWAGQKIGVVVLDPKGDEIWDKTYVADAFGGLDGAMPVAADAPLGVYRVEARVPGVGRRHAGTFRVEEYRKPEFEVAVETPDGPLELGAKAKAVVRANYLFGAPVAGGTAKITVTRTPDEARWLPAGAWDWLYGEGYGFYAYDWDWHPCWRLCCVRASWREGSGLARLSTAPEPVARLTVPLREDGTAEIEWDTELARKLYGEDADQRYRVAVSVTDASRRTVDAEGAVLATAHPFRVRAWAARPWCHDTDTVELRATVTGPGAGAGVSFAGARLLRFDPATGAETELGPVAAPRLDAADAAPAALWRIPAPPRGQYRFAVRAADAAGRIEEASVFFTVLSAAGDPARDLRFAPLELVPDKAEYAPGDVARLALRADRADSWVFLAIRPGTDRAETRWVRLDGKTAEIEVPVGEEDRPDFFVEALAFHDGRFRREVRRIAVPPADKAATVRVEAPERLAPGDEAEVTVRVAGPDGAPPPLASVALSVYDRAIDAVAGGSNVRPILPFFWGWRHEYHPWYRCSLHELGSRLLLLSGDEPMEPIGGGPLPGCRYECDMGMTYGDASFAMRRNLYAAPAAAAAPEAKGFVAGSSARYYGFSGGLQDGEDLGDAFSAEVEDGADEPSPASGAPAVAVRSEFADTAFWGCFPASIGLPGLRPVEGEPGVFRARFAMPDDATGWRVRAWAMLPGACVGEGEARLTTAKDLLVSPALPRFLVQGDDATLAVVVHNRTDAPLDVVVTLAETNGVLDVSADGPEREADSAGGSSDSSDASGSSEASVPSGSSEARAAGHPATRRLVVPAKGSARADFFAYALREGEAAVVATAAVPGGGRTRSDGVARTFPVKLRGLRRVEPFSRVAAPGEGPVTIRFRVPEKRLPEETSLTLRADVSLLPSLWGAVPWLVEYPHGCTEQTLNRFVPAVLVRKALRDAGLSLEAIAAGGVATNAPPRPAAPIARRAPAPPRAPVVTDAELDRIVAAGLKRLGEMQLADGGWGWFSGWGERSAPHTTATVVHGLLAAREAGVEVPAELLSRGLAWLGRDQARRRAEIAADRKNRRAGPEDALVARVLAEGGAAVDPAMLGYLYEDRAQLPFYAKALLGLALDALGDSRRDELARNLRQFLVADAETGTAHFELGNAGWWWHWYGSEIESQAAGLELLLRAAPDDPAVAGLARFLAANRAHGTYWNSTRDTACALEALARYHRLREAPAGAAPGGLPPVRLKLALDGRPLDLPAFAGAPIALPPDLLPAGEHELVVASEASDRPLYVAGALSNFTLEPRIAEAGLEVKVRRTVSRLVERETEGTGRDTAGGVVARKGVAHDRVPLGDRDLIASGDLVEVRLDLEAKNDCEYVLVEDAKAAGLESVEALSGYRWEGDLFPYVEWRDDRVCLYLARLPRGTHSFTYRFRAETPGGFTALPARAEGMYEPDALCANSASLVLGVAP